MPIAALLLTLAHAAAVLPLARPLTRKGYRLPLSALLVGSWVPDLDALLPLPAGFGHSAIGLFAFCWPLGWLGYHALHHALKKPIAALLGPVLGWKIRREINLEWQTPLAVSSALLAGAATHLLWDSTAAAAGQALAWLAAHPELLQLEAELPEPAVLAQVPDYAFGMVGLALLSLRLVAFVRAEVPVMRHRRRRLEADRKRQLLVQTCRGLRI